MITSSVEFYFSLKIAGKSGFLWFLKFFKNDIRVTEYPRVLGMKGRLTTCLANETRNQKHEH